MGRNEVNNNAMQLAPQQAAPVKAEETKSAPEKAEPKHLIAFNAFRAGNKGNAPSQPLSAYDKTISYAWLQQMVEAIRGGDEKLKGLLPFRCAHYYAFEGNHRSQKGIIAESFLFQTTVDVDEKELVETALEMAKLLDTQEFVEQKTADGKIIQAANPWKGQLLHLEYSARKKLHIDIRMPIGMTIEETQRSYCEALGVPCDESCFSPERIIFITDKASEIFRSPHWYEVLPEEELMARREAFRKRGLSIDGRGKSTQCTSKSTQSTQCTLKNTLKSTPKSTLSTQCTLKNTLKSTQCTPQSTQSTLQCTSAASDKNLIAFDLFRAQAGLKDVNIDTEGSRHSSLLAIMSAGASRVMSEEELKRIVSLRMPSFATERDCQQLIHDFYAKYADNTKPFSKDVIRVNALAEKQAQEGSASMGGSHSNPDSPNGQNGFIGQNGSYDSNASQEEDSDKDDNPPEMPKKLPKLVELLISKTPDIYKPAVACAIFPPLATHLWHTRFRYIDNVEHEATLMCALLAGTGAGKNCVQMPINLIMEDIRKRDQENLAREKAWKDEVTRKGANKDKRKRPENLIIQEIDADMTNPAFVMRTAEAQEHFLYTSLNEIDQFDALKGQGNQQFRIMCLAFDPGNQYGQTRVGTQSVTERVCVRFNWNASTTIHKGQKYFSRVLTDGPISRINFCTIPEREIGAEMPVYGTYDEEFKENLRPYIENLCKAEGLIDCREAYHLAMTLKDENADTARLTQSRTYENLSFRANVIAYLKACVLYVANGQKWEKEIDDFIRWSEQYDLWCKMRFFGDAIVKTELEGEKSSKRGPNNLLQKLPDIFSFHEAESVRLAEGLDRKGTKHMLSTWLYRKYIREVESGHDSCHSYHSNSYHSFEKLKFRRDGVIIEKNS